MIHHLYLYFVDPSGSMSSVLFHYLVIAMVAAAVWPTSRFMIRESRKRRVR